MATTFISTQSSKLEVDWAIRRSRSLERRRALLEEGALAFGVVGAGAQQGLAVELDLQHVLERRRRAGECRLGEGDRQRRPFGQAFPALDRGHQRLARLDHAVDEADAPRLTGIDDVAGTQ